MSKNLKERVMQFIMLELPGQPRMMHIGTANLVNDLWNEVQRLQKDAARYRWLLQQPEWLGWDHDFRPDEIEREIDNAMQKREDQ